MVEFDNGTEKSNTASMAKLVRFCRHPDREKQFDLVKPLIAETGVVSVCSLPASSPSYIFPSMVRFIIYKSGAFVREID